MEKLWDYFKKIILQKYKKHKVRIKKKNSYKKGIYIPLCKWFEYLNIKMDKIILSGG